MNIKNLTSLLLAVLLVLSLSACNSEEPVKKEEEHQHTTHEHEENGTKTDDNEAEKVPTQMEKDFQYQLDGLSTLKKDVENDDFESAGELFEQLHEAYHPSVLHPTESEDANLAEEMHSKFDALEEAINKKDKTQTLKMVDTNRQYILQAGKELGLSLK